jgi:hypothetical protein
VPTTILRTTVKGRFAELDEAARARLTAELADHDVLVAGGYHEAGQLTYDRALDFFRYRVQLREDGDDPEADAVERARAMALAELARLGVGHRDLQVTTTDMASMWRRTGGGRAR